MRIHVDLQSHVVAGNPRIIQVENEPEIGAGGQTTVNGKYIIPVPNGLDFPVDNSSYVLSAGVVDGGDVASQGMARLLASYPQFGNVYFNPLLTPDHVGELDPTFQFRHPTSGEIHTPRYQTGRATGSIPEGQMPTHTALLPINSTLSTSRPGLLVSNNIDIGPYTLDCDGNEVGADEFLLYWKIYAFEVTHDVAADFGAHAGENTPALRRILEMDQEPSGFSAYISTDEGANWCPVGLLEPVAFCVKSTAVRIAFLNTGTTKVYLASFALLF